MKTILVYMSISHGNTEKVAKVIAETLSADLKKADQIELSVLSSYDLLGFGSGIPRWQALLSGEALRTCQ